MTFLLVKCLLFTKSYTFLQSNGEQKKVTKQKWTTCVWFQILRFHVPPCLFIKSSWVIVGAERSAVKCWVEDFNLEYATGCDLTLTSGKWRRWLGERPSPLDFLSAGRCRRIIPRSKRVTCSEAHACFAGLYDGTELQRQSSASPWR